MSVGTCARIPVKKQERELNCSVFSANFKNKNKKENRLETSDLLKSEAVEIKTEAIFGLRGPDYPQVSILEAVGAI